jgi:hypothetical protein
LIVPVRIQRKRSKGWRMPPKTVYVGRGTVYGNPFKIGEHWRTGASRVNTGNIAFNHQLEKAFGDNPLTREDCVKAFVILLDYAGLPECETRWAHPKDLTGWNVACWCPLDQPCHADVLLEIANE